jgi:metal-responsive CopG/Arc/MetJ family transcriptional regulator
MPTRVTGQERNEHFSVTLPASAVAKLDAIARARGSSRSAVVCQMVLAGLDREALVQKITEAVA